MDEEDSFSVTMPNFNRARNQFMMSQLVKDDNHERYRRFSEFVKVNPSCSDANFDKLLEAEQRPTNTRFLKYSSIAEVLCFFMLYLSVV